jgi:uncharacterized glyoxalase superfamily protein PhnB
MPDTPHEDRVTPMLAYADAPAAIRFLCEAFGFQEQYRMDMPDGRVGHAELVHGGHKIMLASEWGEVGLVSPRALPGLHSQVFCYVDDADAHYDRARAAGAILVGEPADQHGLRMYRAVDPEGHRWIFGGPMREGRS